jgi:hypothetical protein
MGGAFLEWGLEAFSGYAAVDELYEGPYCVLSAVEPISIGQLADT